MIRTWEGFMEFLRAHDCEPFDETDWAYPIWRRKGTGLLCGLDLDSELDDFLICGVCGEFLIDPPAEHNTNGMSDLVKGIKNMYSPPATGESGKV